MASESIHRILITGGSGLIGSHLTQTLLAAGHQVSHLGRSRRQGPITSFVWNLDKMEMDGRALEDVDTIVHLAGAGIADKPWTKKRKREILESRTLGARLLFEELKKDRRRVRSFISASAIGYYGFDHPEKVYVETDPPGGDFLADVTRRWEGAADEFQSLGIRVVKLRTGIVVSRGGALAEIARPIRYWLGAPQGDGDQFVNWIHVDDLCAMYRQAIERNEMTGVYNAVSPQVVTNRKLTESIAEALGKPLWLPPVPAAVMRFLLGDMANLVLKGAKVSASRILDTGFQFQHVELDDAVRDVMSVKNQ